MRISKCVEVIVRESLLLQEFEMKYITKRDSTLCNDRPATDHASIATNATYLASSSHLPCKQYPFNVAGCFVNPIRIHVYVHGKQ